ncbi:MAG: hypothetical protein A2V64_09030 [Bacteroidetes bacterium RBG_13_43_22]|nr:MAG: hypothetical protein A2V64_09030 [Bacteroidetes bacterium RBG_13_43_22]
MLSFQTILFYWIRGEKFVKRILKLINQRLTINLLIYFLLIMEKSKQTVIKLLIVHDLDDPFAYSKKYSAENVSLYPIRRILSEMEILNRERRIV